MDVEKQKGSVLVTSLLILLVMNLMGIGLMQMSIKEAQIADFKAVDSEVYHITESCAHDGITWLESQTAPSTALPFTITENNLNNMLEGDETPQELAKLNGYSYTCTLTGLISKTTSGEVGTGEEVGETGGYGSSGDMTPKFYYHIDATGSGPQNFTKRILTIVSVIY